MLIKHYKLQLIYRDLLNVNVIFKEKNVIDFLIDKYINNNALQFTEMMSEADKSNKKNSERKVIKRSNDESLNEI